VTGRLLTARQVGETLGVSPETVLRWTRRGELPAIRLPGGAIRYRATDLEAWLAQRETTDAANREALTTRHRARRQGAYGSLESDLLTTSPRLAATTEKEDL
jgi:excisionase family DNA binding protein